MINQHTSTSIEVDQFLFSGAYFKGLNLRLSYVIGGKMLEEREIQKK